MTPHREVAAPRVRKPARQQGVRGEAREEGWAERAALTIVYAGGGLVGTALWVWPARARQYR